MTCMTITAAYGTNDDSVDVIANDEMINCISLHFSESLLVAFFIARTDKQCLQKQLTNWALQL